LHIASGLQYKFQLLQYASGKILGQGTWMRKARRSGCPIHLTLETIGDRWSLGVIRDVILEIADTKETF
jgi:hypothetical protein